MKAPKCIQVLLCSIHVPSMFHPCSILLWCCVEFRCSWVSGWSCVELFAGNLVSVCRSQPATCSQDSQVSQVSQISQNAGGTLCLSLIISHNSQPETCSSPCTRNDTKLAEECHICLHRAKVCQRLKKMEEIRRVRQTSPLRVAK